MKLRTPFRIILGIIAVLLGLWSCVGILGVWFFVPYTSDWTVLQEVELNTLETLVIIAVAVGFALLARWCFTGRGFKRRDKREI